MKDLGHVRSQYGKLKLQRSALHKDPMQQFDGWYQEAAAAITDANAMVLATCANNRPSQRVVLLKSYDQHGYVFYTNYNSQKARELTLHPTAALLFWWPEVERQVRIEGLVSRTTAEASNAYFASRARAAKLGALASPQSDVVDSRDVLLNTMAALDKQYPTTAIPRPPHWGGYCLTPDKYEFWQGGKDRIHDRFVYQRINSEWEIQRLAP